MSLFNDEFSHRDSGNLDDLTGESEELSFLNDLEEDQPACTAAVADAGAALSPVEVRLRALECAVVEHASVVRENINRRLEQIEDLVQRECGRLRGALESETNARRRDIAEVADSMVFALDQMRGERAQSGGGEATAALESLRGAVAATRGELESLADVILRARQSAA
ncbi:MAG TPA: hypothetical protein P5016_05205 [Verrucomicrobiales bacterium]|nr:hypothetical protein [Verrucomicrobiales bacterium]